LFCNKKKENKVVPSCSLGKIELSKESLLERNILLVNIKCKSMPDVSSNCQASKSHITFTCRPGFKFENNQEFFKSSCKYNKWEELPRCLPGMN
jgi:hypothetical protein